jgi:phosphohistidine phosphatase SixA
VLIAGHFPHLPRLLALLVGQAGASAPFPQHGAVLLETTDEGETWKELWRLA